MNKPRRTFLISSAFLVGTLPLFANNTSVYAQKISIYKDPYQTFAQLHKDLFFGSEIGTILDNINSVAFLQGVFNDPYIKQDEKDFLKNGITWLHETSKELYKKNYYHLSSKQRQKVLHVISQENWGNSWLWTVMSYFFEAMLGDPIYGGNQEQKGWKHLDLISGYPRPKEVLYHG